MLQLAIVHNPHSKDPNKLHNTMRTQMAMLRDRTGDDKLDREGLKKLKAIINSDKKRLKK